HRSGHLAGDGMFTKKCNAWLSENTGAISALLTLSCTAALEMAAILLDIKPGDEVIMPSFTFVSTANAFALRGGVPVFVDIRPDTLNIDENLIEAAITPQTKAICVVHYAGVSCEMDAIMTIAERHGVKVVEDAAQGIMSTYKGRHLGTIGQLGAYSFHETKNVISGEGGAILINDAHYVEMAEIIREKGTDRSRFFRGQVDKYTWQEIGSSFLPGEPTAAFLWAQLEDAASITERRLKMWSQYHDLTPRLEEFGVRRPTIPADCQHNAHMYYLLLPGSVDRQAVLRGLNDKGINSVFHYVPLHSSPAGKRFARINGSMNRTNDLSQRLIRLPLWIGLTLEMQAYIVETLSQTLLNQALNPSKG
ncbi:MAG: dTDP-4-amino-4,6-dideoxygalactose transaminase, partial [bacterium]